MEFGRLRAHPKCEHGIGELEVRWFQFEIVFWGRTWVVIVVKQWSFKSHMAKSCILERVVTGKVNALLGFWSVVKLLRDS